MSEDDGLKLDSKGELSVRRARESHGQGSLAGYSTYVHKESDVTEVT